MCIAIFKPHNRVLDKNRLRICDINNPDGAGFAYIDNGELIVRKGYFEFEEFWAAFDAIQQDTPALVHFRIGTAGKNDAYNCHPWSVTDDCAIIHNGTITDFVDSKSHESDTCHFVKDYLKPLFKLIGPKCFRNGLIAYSLEKVIGSNKMVFLDKDGDYAIINASYGEYDDEVWYSNSSFKEVKVKEPVTQTNYSRKTFKRNAKMGWFLPGSVTALSSKEINSITKQYGARLIKLEERGIVYKSAMDEQGRPMHSCSEFGDGEEGLHNWLSQRDAHNAKRHVPLESSIDSRLMFS